MKKNLMSVLILALLVVNLFWFVWGMVLLVAQGVLPLNPDGNIRQWI